MHQDGDNFESRDLLAIYAIKLMQGSFAGGAT